MKELMPIGRFSQVVQLSIRTLRRYDEEGLLPPARVDGATGYRYYSASQVVEAERIRILRELDMALGDIRCFLNENDPERLEELLKEQRRRLEERLKGLKAAIDFLEDLSFRKEEVFLSYAVEMREVPDRWVLSIRFPSAQARLKEDIPAAFEKVCGYVRRSGTPVEGMGMVLYHCGEDFDPANMDVEVCLPLAEPVAKEEGLECRLLPGGTFAGTLHKGSYSRITLAYGALSEWARERDIPLEGPAREVYLNCPEEVSEDELRTEVLWPVAKR